MKTLRGLARQSKARLGSHHSHSDSVNPLLLAIGIVVVALALLSLIQYARFGFDLFLGWDTSSYVWWSNQVLERGALAMILNEWSYPHLYILTLAGFGSLLGDTGLVMRVLPTLVAIPLGYAYYRLTTDITSSRWLGLLAAVLGAIVINTINLYIGLHRNFLALAVALAIGVYVFRWVSSKAQNWRAGGVRVFLSLSMLAIVAYSHLETYLVLSLTLIILFLLTRESRVVVRGFLLLAAPLLALAPLLGGFVQGFQEGSTFFLPVEPFVILADLAVLTGAFALPFVVVGAIQLYRIARSGNPAARFVGWWFLVLAGLAPIAFILGLPPTRVLHLAPLPILLALSVGPVTRWIRAVSQRITRLWSGRPSRAKEGKMTARGAAIMAAALVIAPTLLTSILAADVFARPYVKPEDIARLTAAARQVRGLGYTDPIVVMYGPQAAYFSLLYRAYFGIEIPLSLTYYGKLQFLFTLPENPDVYVWRFAPSIEEPVAGKYRAELLTRLGERSDVASYPIVVVTGASYDRPLSEPFLEPFRMGSGLYVIPPETLTPEAVDHWRLFAHADWTTASALRERSAPWSVSPLVLEWFATPPDAMFEATYTVNLAQPWSPMELVVRLWDRESPFRFLDGSTHPLAPLEVFFDDQLVHVHEFGGKGPLPLAIPLDSVSAGVHRITLRTGLPQHGVALSLDTLELCPNSC